MSCRTVQAAIAMLSCVLCMTQARAEAPLAGKWHGEIAGTPVALALDDKGGGTLDGQPIRYQVLGKMLFIQQGAAVSGYQFELRNGELLIAGQNLPGVVVLKKGSAPATSASAAAGAQDSKGGVRPELVGQWCKSSSFTANQGGGSQSNSCFVLRPNGTYVYSSSSSMDAYAGPNRSGTWGAGSSQSGDTGRWTATAYSITAQSSSGRVTTYRLEKRNNKNNDAMLCLDGDCYYTATRRPPW